MLNSNGYTLNNFDMAQLLDNSAHLLTDGQIMRIFNANKAFHMTRMYGAHGVSKRTTKRTYIITSTGNVEFL